MEQNLSALEKEIRQLERILQTTALTPKREGELQQELDSKVVLYKAAKAEIASASSEVRALRAEVRDLQRDVESLAASLPGGAAIVASLIAKRGILAQLARKNKSAPPASDSPEEGEWYDDEDDATGVTASDEEDDVSMYDPGWGEND
ncbi:MAG TPA: hypothetical protein VM370_12535 [Candidatus Thermoplasmatota archaeon]|nr:hypothetical protein [Candidatus Thermoplasmatota archaeon]